MSKARTLGDVVSTGAVLADGTVAASEVTGLPTFPSGGVVGTSDVQTLTNKTITYADNTLTGVAPTAQPTLTGLKETKVAVAASDIDLSAGNYFTKTISGATTFTVSNVASSGSVAAFVLDLTDGGAAAVTWWSGITWNAATPPTLTASGVDTLAFFSYDGGTSWRGFVLGLNMG